MKRTGHKKMLGIAIGERSLMIAEVIAGVKPEIRRLGELVYTEGLSPANPAELGAALSRFLTAEQFTSTQAVLGIPVRWLVAQNKEVPAADDATLTSILRLQAEAEFSAELKDLVFDYTRQGVPSDKSAAGSVLLLATPRRYVDAAVALCSAAKLTPISVTASAIVLGDLTGKAMSRSALVLSVGATGAEMTSPRGSGASAIRHLRPPVPRGPFVNELRRVVSTLPSAHGKREMILWDGLGMDAGALANELGGQPAFAIHSGELSALGVEAGGAARNGEGRKFASAVALALAGLDGNPPAVDFLHSRLAPPKEQLIPRWAMIAGMSLLAAILVGALAFRDLQSKQSQLAAIQSELNAKRSDIAAASVFVTEVSFAQAWHGGDPRYLSCLRDLTNAMVNEHDTYATGLILRENAKTGGGTQSNAKAVDTRLLLGVLSGKTSDQGRVQALLDHMRKIKGFNEVKLGSSNAARGHEVTFTINFSYLPGKPTP